MRGFKGFAAFAGMYVAACEVLDSEARLRRVVSEVVEDAARDGVVWIEPAGADCTKRTSAPLWTSGWLEPGR